jgi:hypothetical protein
MHPVRPIDLPAALLFATAAAALAVAAACAFLLVAIVVVSGHDAVAMRDGTAALWCAAAACACATVAALLAVTRGVGLRPPALVGTWMLAFAWPLTGVPIAAGIAATLATAFVVQWGARPARSGRAEFPAAAGLAIAALVLLTAASGGAPAATPPADARPVTTGPDAPLARTPRADAPQARAQSGAAPAPTPPTHPPRTGAPGAAAPSPADAVRAYYRALDRRDFTAAWRRLSPGVRAGFGGFDTWRAGFSSTLSSLPTAIRVQGNVVDLVLVARDRAACGVLVQRFAVRWQLRATHAVAITGRRLAPPTCPE